jgi:hypothetical protein
MELEVDSMVRRLVYALLVFSLTLSGSKAFASSLSYTLTNASSGDIITFSVPLPPTILACNFFSDTSCFAVTPDNLTVDGTPLLDPNEQVDYFNGTQGGGLVIWDPITEAVLINQGGPMIAPGVYQTLYSGTLTDPTLENFTNLQLQTYGYGSPEYNESFVLNATGATTATPEPGSILLLGTGLLGLAGAVRLKFGR